MTTKKKITAAASAIILFIILWAAMISAANEGAFTTVSCGRIDLTPGSDYLMTPGGFAFDTGSTGSVILDDSLPTIPLVGIGFTSDYKRRPRTITFSLLPTLSLSDRVTISNLLTANHKGNGFFRQKGIKIIVGMNAIRHANWLFSFRENRAEALPLDRFPPIPSHALCLPFGSNRTPTARLKIRQTTLDFLIDTGYKGELTIQDPAALKEICNGLTFSTDTVSFNVLFSEQTEPAHTFDSLTIEGTTHRNIVIRAGDLNILGLKFLRRHDTMFWDSANQRMFLWNESTPPAVKEASPDGEDTTPPTDTQG